jgi:protein TonB
MNLGLWRWAAATAAAVLIHAGLFMGLRVNTPGEPPSGTGPQVQVIGSLTELFGPDERQPEEPSPAVAAEATRVIAAEPPGAASERLGPRSIEAEDSAPPAETVESAPAATASATPAEFEDIEVIPAQGEDIAMPAPRPAPTQAERARASQPPRTTPSPSPQRGTPRQAASGVGDGQRRSGAPAASAAIGSGRERTSASPGEVSHYAGIVRARIARNRPSPSGRRGTAVIAFAIGQGGNLRFVRLARSSGDNVLDEAAVASVRRAAPFPPPPPGMSAAQLTFSIPFRFR